ncbi:MAG: hypothetical protein IPM54_34270 [Polyangiaceae bacterium]|nr:hypothetical protein [Polyangiaceae bacterium]
MARWRRGRGLPPAVCSAYDEYVLPHYAPAPDVRYVGLVPGPNFNMLTIAAGSVGVSSIGLALGPDAALWSITSGVLPIGLAALAGATCAVGITRQLLRLKAPVEAREVHMAIVPWGVIVDHGSEPRILRWPAVRKIEVAVKHTLQGGTPSIVSSVVTVRTEREAFSGYAYGAVGLETLMANVEAYAHEASRPLSSDLDGHEPLGDGEFAPIAAELVRRAHDLCSTNHGAAELALPPAGYRRTGSSMGPETLGILGRSLDGDVPGVADPRPLAALVAALLDAKDLGLALVRLANRPNPVVAAVARAAALRLGVPPAKAGSVDELSEFLADEDRYVLGQFAAGAPIA